MTTQISEPNSRSFICLDRRHSGRGRSRSWPPMIATIVCWLALAAGPAARAQPVASQDPNNAMSIQQQQQQAAAAILASMVNPAAAAQRPQPQLEQANQEQQQQQQALLNAAAQFGNSMLGSQQQLNSLLLANNGSVNYREQGEILRQEILRRAGHLQRVVASSSEMIKNSGDLIVSRLLDQMNQRLNVAKSKADKIINEPTTNEMALRALGAINQGLNNVNNIIQNIVNQNRSKLNLQQISRQFSSALSAVQKQMNQQQQSQLQSQQLT